MNNTFHHAINVGSWTTLLISLPLKVYLCVRIQLSSSTQI